MRKILRCFILLIPALLWSSCVKPEDQKSNVIDFLSWEKVKLGTDQVEYVNVELDGFIQFVGESDYPEVRLWESSEAMKYERPFTSISVNSESICPILLMRNESPVLKWKELNGKYVRIRGIFQDQKNGFDYIDLGNFVKVFDLTVTLNDGLGTTYSAHEKGTDKPSSPE